MPNIKQSVAVMQPYIFPYIGYFHLIEASDKFIIYDDVNYSKKSWINRNRILLNKTDFLFTIPTLKASQNKLINDIHTNIDDKWKHKFLTQIEYAYKKSPYYNQIIKLIEETINIESTSIVDLCIKSIEVVYTYLNLEFNYTKSSNLSPETKGIKKEDRLIQITKKLHSETYINAIGGKAIYNKTYFKTNGIELLFIKSKLNEYEQFNNDFISGLSIIDVLMFNDKPQIIKHLKNFTLD